MTKKLHHCFQYKFHNLSLVYIYNKMKIVHTNADVAVNVVKEINDMDVFEPQSDSK